MVKLIGPLHSTEARGRIDSLVYGTYRGTRYVRSFTSPEFGSPDPRADQKARIAAANAAWKLLDSSEQSDWHKYAQSHPRSDWTGVSIRISGYNAFVSCFVFSLRAGGTPLDSPPTGVPPFPLSSLSSSQSDNDIDVTWTYPTQPAAHTYVVQILRSGPWSLGRQPDYHRAAIVSHSPIAAPPFTDTIDQNGRYGYWARVIDADTGETSPFLRCLTDWVYVPPPTPYVEGPLSPGTVADRTGYGTKTWSNPSNAKTSNNVYADVVLPSGDDTSHYLYASNFGFSAAIEDAAVIDGIVVEIERFSLNYLVRDSGSPKLVNAAGALFGTAKPSGTAWGTIDPNTYKIYGSSTDKWGTSGLTGADVKDPDFGVVLAAVNDGTGTKTAKVDHIRMTIYCTNP